MGDYDFVGNAITSLIVGAAVAALLVGGLGGFAVGWWVFSP